MAIEIRPLTLANDAESIAAIVSLIEPEPVLPQHVREWDDVPVDGKQVYRIGAFAPTGQMIGYGAASTGPWLPERNFSVVAIVLPEYRRQGIGARLFDELADWSHARGAQRLKSEIRDNDPAALRFAHKRNFEIERHIFESVLDLTAFDFAPWLATVPAAKAAGIRFFTFGDILDTEENRRRLFDLNRVLVFDMPDATGFFPTFELYNQLLLDRPQFRADGQIIAADGDVWIGMASVSYSPEHHSAYNSLTGVVAAYRGRGIAQALKLKAIERAREYGARSIRTNNNAKNAPMLAINRKLGYQAQPGEYMLAERMPTITD